MPGPHPPLALRDARAVLADVFGYPEYRPGQQEVIESILSGRDTLAVMPTGAGKSICYQLPAQLFDGGVTIVVSPLLALMKDQVDALQRAGIAAAAVNSTISRDEQAAILREAETRPGEPRILYVAPERFGDGAFMAALRGLQVNLLAIDEAHCISQWGHDFRPSYRDLGEVRPRIGSPPIIALTATADPTVRADIVERLRLDEPSVHVSGFDRPNLRFEAIQVRTQKEKPAIIAEHLRALDGESAIVYCATRKKVEALTDALQRERIRCARYHAGLESDERIRIQNAFARDSLKVIVATNAFGLGIDKPDVRAVIHHDIPDSIESYYQEAGRAGRDGEPATCTLLFAPRDRGTREFFIELSHPTAEFVLDVYHRLVSAGGPIFVRELLEDEDAPGLNAAIQTLVDSGLAERRGQRARALREGGEEQIDLAGLEAHRAHAEAKLDSMQWYAESHSCLRARILDYFGESGHRAECGNCGPCAAGTGRRIAEGRPSESPERLLFEALRTVRRTFAEQENVPPYTIISDASLREMARKRPVTQVQLRQVSGVGEARAGRYGDAFLRVIRESAGVPASDASNALYERLRTVRLELAKRDGVPAYVIAPNTTLAAIAEAAPRTPAELGALPGVGPATLERYGEALLAAVAGASPPTAERPRVIGLDPGRERFRGRDGTPLPGSVRQTYRFYQDDPDVEAIARRSGLTPRTIASHIATLVTHGLVDDVSPWIDDVTLARIGRLAGDEPVGALKPLKLALGDEVSYDQLTIARARLNREAP